MKPRVRVPAAVYQLTRTDWGPRDTGLNWPTPDVEGFRPRRPVRVLTSEELAARGVHDGGRL